MRGKFDGTIRVSEGQSAWLGLPGGTNFAVKSGATHFESALEANPSCVS